MQQDNFDMENKLRQLENQQLPDLSAMDTHWKQMEQQLVPKDGTAVPRRKRNNKFLRLLVAAGFIGAAVTIYFARQGKNNTARSTTKSVEAPVIVLDNSTNNQHSIPLPHDASSSSKPNTTAASTTKQSSTPVSPVIKIDAIPDTVAIAATPLPETAPAMTLSNFYAQLQKPVQQFIINSTAGAVINAEEGTRLLIPPSAFIDANGKAVEGSITITVQEFYNYADMVAAHLTTTSNDEQLITGGMIKLAALYNNQEVQLRNGKNIQVSMPGKNYDPQMELFLPETSTDAVKNNSSNVIDSAAPTNMYNLILNWLATERIKPAPFSGTTNFLDLSDEPVRVRDTRKKRIGVFRVSNELPMTVAEIKAVLKEKFGDYYTEIKVRRVKPVVRHKIVWYEGESSTLDFIGDSTQLTLSQALRWHYIKKSDSAFYAEKIKRDSLQYIANNQSQFWNNLNLSNKNSTDPATEKRLMDSLCVVFRQRMQVEQTYNFSVPRMGWINCDRFSKYKNTINFAVHLPADVPAEKFVAQLVFADIKSVMPGQYGGNQLGFANVPPNKKVYVVALGEHNGKVVSIFQHCTTSDYGIKIDQLEETTPEAFRKKLKQLDL